MPKSLKQKNQPQIVTFVIANVVLLGVLAVGLPKFLSSVEGISKGNWGAVGKLIAVPAVLGLFTGILGWAIPRRGKEALVYWKTGRYCLPSSRAFTEIGPNDPRIDMASLTARLGLLPKTAAEQTALWYRVYRRHGDEASVEDAHAAYLKYRDMTGLSLTLVVGSTLVDSLFHIPHRQMAWSLLILIFEYLLVMFAARNASTHFVANVLAVESASTPDQERAQPALDLGKG